MAATGISKSLHRFYVGNLPWTVSNKELKQFFSQFGHISVARVIFKRETGMSKRYGFIEIADKNTYETILNQNTLKLEGRTIVVKQADN